MKNDDKKLYAEFRASSACTACLEHSRKERSRMCPDEMDLSAYIDGKLSDKDNELLEAHLAECPDCLDILLQMRITDAKIEKADYKELNESIFNKLFKPAIPFNSFRHMKVAALAASLIILFSVVMVTVSSNKTEPMTDAGIARVVELYNNNKFYRLSETSDDGFEPSDSFSSTTRYMAHIADTDKNGRISMNEVLEYISKNNPQPTNHVAGN